MSATVQPSTQPLIPRLPTEDDLLGDLSEIRLPTEDDLPYEDDQNTETFWHVLQAELLRQVLEILWAGRDRFFIGGDQFLYFSAEQLLTQDFRGPDFYLALDVEKRMRKSWVVWQEGKAPDLIIELLSRRTARNDRTTKKQVYQDQVRVPEYYWYDPEADELAGFALRDRVYEPIVPDERGRLVSPLLGLALARWRGPYSGWEELWIRWETLEGELLPTHAELAASAQAAAEQEAQRAEREASRVAALEARLRELGVDPDA